MCPFCGASLPSPAVALAAQSLGLAHCVVCAAVVPGTLGEDRPLQTLNRDGTLRDEYTPAATAEHDIARVFTDVLPRKGFRLRPGQRSMAVAVQRALDGGQVLLADAGVGIGKSFAYLVPLLTRHAGLLVLSTSTLLLQEQLAADAERLARLLDLTPPEIVISKGETHYACRSRLANGLRRRNIPGARRYEAETLERRLDALWAGRDRPSGFWESETLSALEVSPALRPRAAVRQRTPDDDDRSDCARCALAGQCGFQAMLERRRAQVGPNQRKLLIVNHGLLLSDLQLRHHGFPGLWPAPAAIVIDEAHDLEGKARSALTKSISPRAAGGVLRTLAQAYPDASAHLASLDATTRQLQEAIHVAVDTYPEPGADRIPLSPEVRQLARKVGHAAEAASTVIGATGGGRREARRSVQAAAETLLDWYECTKRLESSDPGVVASIEGLAVSVAPGSVAADLSGLLFTVRARPILCSATLLCGATFDEVRQVLGIAVGALTVHAPSPFNYRSRLRVFASPAFPRVPPSRDEREGQYMDCIVFPTLDRLLAASQGRALILSSSRHRAHLIYDHLRQRSPYRVIWQDDRFAVEEFRADASSVLVGTGKLFTGIDVPGDSLSLLVMDRIPYPVPDDPLYRAKEALALAAGRTPAEVRWDWARSTLAQGAGRLIRSTEDWGVLALLDPRAAPGGRDHALVAAALPPGAWVQEHQGVEEFFGAGPPEESAAVDDLTATVIALGRSPRMCFGFSADAVNLLKAEGPLPGGVSVYLPGGKRRLVEKTKPSAETTAAVVCAADPDLPRVLNYLRGQGHDVLVTGLRGGPWAERLLLPEVQGRALPVVRSPNWVQVAVARQWAAEEDRLGVAEACLRAVANRGGAWVVMVTSDAAQRTEVEQFLKGTDIELAHVTVATLQQAARTVGLWTTHGYVVLLDVPEDAEEDLARLIALMAYSGDFRCLIVASLALVDEMGPLAQALGLAEEEIRQTSLSDALKAFRARFVRHQW